MQSTEQKSELFFFAAFFSTEETIKSFLNVNAYGTKYNKHIMYFVILLNLYVVLNHKTTFLSSSKLRLNTFKCFLLWGKKSQMKNIY